jgi:DNA polymerase III alpha subunit (gram-positive type)
MSDTLTVIRSDDAHHAAPDFVVIDVETACSRVSSICQVGIVGFRDGREIFEYETLIDPRDEFHAFNTRIHGIASIMSRASRPSATSTAWCMAICRAGRRWRIPISTRVRWPPRAGSMTGR